VRILLIDTNRFAQTARMAMAFGELGCEVGVVCPPKGHPARTVRSIRTYYNYRSLSPLGSLRSAIRAFDPEAILPCDELGFLHLHRLHAMARASNDSGLADCIERSLGPAGSFPITMSRYDLLKLAREEGVAVPTTRVVHRDGDLSWLGDAEDRPWALKTDGSYGGLGVWKVSSASEARRALANSARSPFIRWLVKRLVSNRDFGFILEEWLQPLPNLVAQEWIEGRPANFTVACWEGQTLAGIGVEVVASHGEKGASVIVEVVEGTEMMHAAKSIAKRLRLSGFYGLDFMIEHRTGRAYLIEMNTRCVPLSALALGPGRDLPAAFCSCLAGRPVLSRKPYIESARIARFPDLEVYDVSRSFPEGSYYYDVPYDEPDLILRLRAPWKSLTTRLLKLVHKILRRTGSYPLKIWIPVSDAQKAEEVETLQA